MSKIRQIKRYCDIFATIVLPKYHTKMTVYMYGKKNKKKNKNVRKKNVFLSLWSRSVGIYDFRVDTFCQKKVSGDRK